MSQSESGIVCAEHRADRVIADKGYPSKKNRAWLREREIAATIPELASTSAPVALICYGASRSTPELVPRSKTRRRRLT